MVNMRINRTHLPVLLLLLLTSSCKVQPEPIVYGSDACHFCRMTIVDKQHGAELVTKKGKVFKFDAAECMLNYVKSIEEQTVGLFLTNSYKRPGDLLDATRAYYLISEEIPSPMGEYLTAFAKEADAVEARKKHGGTLYSWKELRNLFKP